MKTNQEQKIELLEFITSKISFNKLDTDRKLLTEKNWNTICETRLEKIKL